MKGCWVAKGAFAPIVLRPMKMITEVAERKSLTNIALCVMEWTNCLRPRRKLWEKWVQSQKCRSMEKRLVNKAREGVDDHGLLPMARLFKDGANR